MDVTALTAEASNTSVALCGSTNPDHPPVLFHPHLPLFLLPLLSCSHPFRWRRSAKPPRLCVRRILTQLCLPNAISRVVKAEIKADINSLLTLILCAIIDLRTRLRSYPQVGFSAFSRAGGHLCEGTDRVREDIFRDLFRNWTVALKFSTIRIPCIALILFKTLDFDCFSRFSVSLSIFKTLNSQGSKI